MDKVTRGNFVVCANYQCTVRYDVAMTEAEWARVRAFFDPPAADPAAASQLDIHWHLAPPARFSRDYNRLKKAEKLEALKPNNYESLLAVAEAALDMNNSHASDSTCKINSIKCRGEQGPLL